MNFTLKDTLTEEEIEKGLKNVIRDGLTSQAMITLTGGIFLVAFALNLGASNTVIGLLAAIPALAQLIQIPSIYLIEKFRVRRAITIYAGTLSRMFLLFISLIPFLFTIEAGLAFLIVALSMHTAFAAVGNSSWNPWMRDLVPEDRLGTFYSKRMRFTIGIGIPLSLLAGYYIDYWKQIFPDYELYGFSILFFFGFLVGMLGIYFVSKIPEPRMAPAQGKPKLFNLLLEPFKDVNFKNLIMFLGPWNFAVNLAAPFFTVYMLKRLQMDLSFIIALGVLSQLTSIAFLRIWGRFSDRFSNKSVLRVSGPLFMLCILGWTFTTMPETYILTVPLLIVIHIFMGISMSAVTLASGNIAYKLAPKGNATSYLATNSFVNSLAAGIAPVLGGGVVDFFTERKLAWMLSWESSGEKLDIPILHFQGWDFFFFLAFLIGLYSIHRLSLVKEEGSVKGKRIIHEFISETRRELRNFSTIGGLRNMAQFTISAVKGTQKSKL